jgi:hypothetical protein
MPPGGAIAGGQVERCPASPDGADGRMARMAQRGEWDFPHSSKVGSSRFPQMRELRTQSAGRPLRTLYAFTPLRSAILLIGGDKNRR